jgi:hypothetical protein
MDCPLEGRLPLTPTSRRRRRQALALQFRLRRLMRSLRDSPPKTRTRREDKASKKKLQKLSSTQLRPYLAEKNATDFENPHDCKLPKNETLLDDYNAFRFARIDSPRKIVGRVRLVYRSRRVARSAPHLCRLFRSFSGIPLTIEIVANFINITLVANGVRYSGCREIVYGSAT